MRAIIRIKIAINEIKAKRTAQIINETVLTIQKDKYD